MKKKRIGKRVLAAVLAALICAAGIVGFVNREKVLALFSVVRDAKTDIAGLTAEEKAKFYASYTRASLDMVNGEVVLTADRKANVLTNVYNNKEKLTILEIVPYELASVYDILVPTDKQREKVNAYAEYIFNNFNQVWYSGDKEWSLLSDNDVRILGVQDGSTKVTLPNSKAYYTGDETRNSIATCYQPISVLRTGSPDSYDYSVYMPNYYIANLLDGYEKTKIYDYYMNNNNVEVKIVVPGQVTAAELQKILLGTDDGSNDPVDLIYVGGYAVNSSAANFGNIYRNVFFSDYVPDEPDANVDKVMDFIKNGNGVENFDVHTNVYRADGNEYKVSELVEEKVWYNSYSKDADGNLIPNDLEWDEVEVIMNYVFGSYNRNYVHIDEFGNKEQQRVSCEFQIPTLSNGVFRTSDEGCDNNIGKLYYLMCKTTDQASDEDGCTLDSSKAYSSIHKDGNSSTHTPYYDISTYYWSPNYFLNELFDSDSELVNNSNGVKTLTYNGNRYWNFNLDDRQGIYIGYEEGDFENEDEIYTSEIARIKGNMMEPLGGDKEYELFYIHKVFNGRFVVYNGMLGVDPDAVGNLLNFGLAHAWGEGGWREAISHQRLDLAVGENFMDQFNIINYLLGIDDTDFITKPDAYFTEVELVYDDGNVIKNVEQGADSNAFYTYLYDEDYKYDEADIIYPDTVRIRYAADDDSANMTEGVLKAYKLNGTEIATLKTYSKDEVNGRELFEADYDISGNEEVYQAFKDGNIYFTFTIKNEITIKGVVKEFADTAYLYFKHRDIFDLD